jgi:hypothetical protein
LEVKIETHINSQEMSSSCIDRCAASSPLCFCRKEFFFSLSSLRRKKKFFFFSSGEGKCLQRKWCIAEKGEKKIQSSTGTNLLTEE